jgi:hypothetical protein
VGHQVAAGLHGLHVRVRPRRDQLGGGLPRDRNPWAFPTGAYELSPDDFEAETGNATLTWEEEGPDQDDLDLDPEHILAWGYTNHADILCWMTSDPDPDKWPVLLFARHGSVPCEVVPCGMVEFLRRLFVNELASYSLDFPPAPRFVHWREERGLPPLAR